ncbi:proline racemase family protein [Verrucomicrobiaceae bacterium N1E253]|uniref:Proline racemase family protein n=1 Tax=Oceaniferula marina TaxID=2748318 RepID=A0A851GL43_9BACT|nr:proline racemase family protein [Oceaniferula marina]NWK55895.1 proline racemase family protein [Oceaniferula marina]
MSNPEQPFLRIIDSHTGGEPTRVVTAWPESVRGLDEGSLMERRKLLEEKYDWIRSACIHEPRGHEAMVGALLCPPVNPECVTGVIFFNNVGYLNGCVHGTIGVTVTLAHLGRIAVGKHRIETPVGEVLAEWHDDGSVTVTNVPSYRYRRGVSLNVGKWGKVTGDVAWGGNWFFLVDRSQAEQCPEVVPECIAALTEFSSAVSTALKEQSVTGAEGMEIDHVEVFGDPTPGISDSRSFVLCPGKAYDRSPCGTGTSAKLACLFADGKLQLGQVWKQASILNTVFEGRVIAESDGQMTPQISGHAHVNGEAIFFLREEDPFRYGIPTH